MDVESAPVYHGNHQANRCGRDRQLTLAFRIDRSALAQAQALDGKYLLGPGLEWEMDETG
jgi:hypothetical protein